MVRTKELDGASLKALAHPLRVRMLWALEARGQASVTSLARELAESTGSTSYHLRQLAKHGLVEEVEPGEGGANESRQRFWRLAADELHVKGFEMLNDSETSAAAGFVLREAVAERARRQLEWYATATTWSKAWQDASSGRDARLLLDAAQTRAMADEMAAVMEKYRDVKPGPDARRVEVSYEVYPAKAPS